MKRKHKSYSRPKRPFDKVRIDEEAEIKTEYGLKNKKEIWKAEAKIDSMRVKAKRLVRATEEEKQVLFNKLNQIGLKVTSLAEVLSLDKKDYLERRLQTVLFRKNLASTVKLARQLITHRKVLIDGKVVSIPSYIVPRVLEGRIKLKVSAKALENMGKKGKAGQSKKSKEEKDFEESLPVEEVKKGEKAKETPTEEAKVKSEDKASEESKTKPEEESK